MDDTPPNGLSTAIYSIFWRHFWTSSSLVWTTRQFQVAFERYLITVLLLGKGGILYNYEC